ncbi:DNA polymerase epsilon catalytic subunit [Artemisia annua]|uniref:DNA polymerase epsilon catalytic subunit n=1 Tax=Artemisia annua TaxID=35608 RepID=A0A2U1Q8U0_ARTAN|nr:DNA polymerase epsilon catalytic subunit [Artemisia annua]
MKIDNRRRGVDDHRDTRISKKQKVLNEEELETKLGFDLYTQGDTRLGWLLTFSPSSWEDRDTRKVYSCLDLYFVCQDGSTFKVKYKFRPYFYAATKDKMESDVDAYLRRKFEGQIADIEIVEKEDLDLKNHLSGLRKTYLKISFDTVQQLMQVKNDLMRAVERNRENNNAYESILAAGKRKEQIDDFIDCIIDLREYDVSYHVRCAIDNDIRCGLWYDVNVSSGIVTFERRLDLLQRAEVHVCAFDIETTKLPLKFPDADYDLVMMISYMVDGRGYLIINRECVGEDIDDLEYTPKPEFEGHFKVTNVKNEEELLRLWFSHMREVKPGIYVTYNGDFFDWPFLENRAAHHGLKMNDAVTKAKLGYDPLEVNPEDMVRFAMEKPQMMASYSVSDAVSTYYLYMTYVHPFIFSLATIIPMPPDEVLRKGSGTLCEMLLMVQAYTANVICPNKHQPEPEKFYNGHLLESETYIGGHVECLETGVFRSDLPTSFKLDPSAFNKLIENLDRDLRYAIRVEGKMDVESVSNYDEVKKAIMEKLIMLRDEPTREECPLIYHLDVAAMYPNIILTNRLQPSSIVTDDVCTACDFNRPGKTCLRKMEWVWRGETYTANRSDYYHIKRQIESEFVDGPKSKPFIDLPKVDQQLKLKERLKKYCQKAYKRVLDKPVTEIREAGICMRENPFYVDTVRRRYEYKGLNKIWKGKLSEAKASGNSIKIQEAQDMVVLYDSLQLAHKCILNSFYGYVMRKGARWYSMEMAGIVTYTGAKIIQNAHLLVKKIGKPLELDTDGIWCALPGSFPENFTFKTKDSKKKLTISYPCVMLNVDVARNNTNDQYQTLKDPVNRTYTTHSECSIEFEVDGPYKNVVDLEDFGGNRKSSGVGPIPIVRCYETNRKTSGQGASSMEKPDQDKHLDYQGWLDSRKRKWKQVREKRKRQRLDNLGKSDGVNGVGLYFKRQELVLTHSYWQIIQIVPSSQNGQYFAWAIVDGTMHKIPVKVPRVFYLNYKAPSSEGFPGRLVNKILPHGQRCYNLIEVITDEDQYRTEQRKLAAHLADLEVEGIYLVYFPSWSTIHAVVVTPYKNKELSPQGLNKQFREACQALSIEAPISVDASSFKVDYVGNTKDADKILQRTISEFRFQLHGPAIAIIECPDVNTMKSKIQALEDFPCVNIPLNARDSQFPIGWQIIAAKTGMQHCVASSRWLDERISLSRYSHVPLGNLEQDWLIYTADLLFARALRDQQQILWISDNGIPDLGGNNDAETCYADEVDQPIHTFEGAYRRVTVELKIHNLAVNALLKSHQINEMEGSTLFGLDEAMSCSPAFRVLKQLIQRCLADAVSSGNIFADAMLQNLYQWLCSPRSKLHDPALYRMLHKVMQKMLALLLAELKNLGATVIFANFSKIILDTGKRDLLAAQAYCDSLLKTLQTRELFEWIELESTQFWVSLLFMDQYNYGGVQAKSDQTIVNPQVESNWNIAEDLPEETRDHFDSIVSDFIYLPWKFAQDQANKQTNIRDDDSCTPSITAAAGEMFQSCMTEDLREKIRSHFTNKLFGIVTDLQKRGKGKSDAQELIKRVCVVFELDKDAASEIQVMIVQIMKKNLLKIIKVKEFAPEADFKRCLFSFALPNMICSIVIQIYHFGSYCNDFRDLDLLRDRSLLTQHWRCNVPQCGQPYNREVIENSLLQIARQKERLYHLQDLACSKCKQIKAAHLAEHCECAGSFTLKKEVTVFRKEMAVLLNIAVRQKFELLKECVSWILELDSVDQAYVDE